MECPVVISRMFSCAYSSNHYLYKMLKWQLLYVQWRDCCGCHAQHTPGVDVPTNASHARPQLTPQRQPRPRARTTRCLHHLRHHLLHNLPPTPLEPHCSLPRPANNMPQRLAARPGWRSFSKAGGRMPSISISTMRRFLLATNCWP